MEGTINVQVGDNKVLERSSEELSCSSEEIGMSDWATLNKIALW